MLTVEEAYLKISKKISIINKLKGCLDFGDFFLFSIAPAWIKDDQNYLVGTVFDAVDKKTGKIFQYDITSDPEAFLKAKKVEIPALKTVFNKKIKGGKSNA